MRGSPLVAEKTRQRVLEVARSIRYVRNQSAANLRTQKSNIVGLVVCDIANPFYGEFTAGIEAACDRHGWVTFLCNSAESIERQEMFLHRMQEHHVEGIIISPAAGTPTTALRDLQKAGVPYVQALRYLHNFPHDFVGVDSRLGMALATEHLIRLGHKRIAFIGGGSDTSATRDRTGGYIDAMRRNGLGPDPNLIVRTGNSRDDGAAAINALLDGDAPPTATVCYADVVALGVMWALRERGVRPGEDFAVIGHDDISDAAWSRPALTTISTSPREVGKEAVELLFRRIAEPIKPPERIMLPPRLIVRDSCGGAKRTIDTP